MFAPLPPFPEPRRAGPNGPGRAFTRPRRAFTLVELLIVLLIVSTLAATAMPTLSSTMAEMKATALAREIVTDIRYAQTLAVRTGKPHRVTFSVSGQSYSVQADLDEDGAFTTIAHPVTKRPWQCELDEHRRYAGIKISKASFGGESRVDFDAYGSPSSGGAVAFALGHVIRTITVAPLSGKMTVE